MYTSIITTVHHNIGDDFVREGIISILSDIVKIDRIELIHKHSPIPAIYGLERIRKLRYARITAPLLRIISKKNRISDANLLIQSGAPIYWCHPNGPHCADNEWFDPLIRKRFLPDRRNRKFLNIAGGSCQCFHSDGAELNSCTKCKSYIAELFDVCNLTLLRDNLARRMLNITGRDAEILPCTSIFARDYLNIPPSNGEYIVVNYMKNGGHYTFGQNIDTEKWRKNFASIVKKLQRYGNVIAACHTPNEKQQVKEFLPDIKTYIVPDNHIDFMKFYSGARFAIVNRVHAGFMMASYGKPVAIIGNDSRALMAKNLNLTPYYVEDIDNTLIDIIIHNLLSREHSYHDEIEEIRNRTREIYIEKISNTLAL